MALQSTPRSCLRPQARRICQTAPMQPRPIVVAAASSRAAILASPTDDYLRNKLDSLLSGVNNKTRRQEAKVLKVLHVSRAGYTHNKLDRRPRCGRLDLDLLWESKPITLPATDPVQGLARVTLSTTGSSDKVDIKDVQVLEAADDDSPRMPSSKATPPDVLLAVESMDGVIMQQLNEFLWELEQSQDFMLSSMECEDQDDVAEEAGSYNTGVAVR